MNMWLVIGIFTLANILGIGLGYMLREKDREMREMHRIHKGIGHE